MHATCSFQCSHLKPLNIKKVLQRTASASCDSSSNGSPNPPSAAAPRTSHDSESGISKQHRFAEGKIKLRTNGTKGYLKPTISTLEDRGYLGSYCFVDYYTRIFFFFMNQQSVHTQYAPTMNGKGEKL